MTEDRTAPDERERSADEPSTKAWLKRQCEYLRGHLLARGICDEADIVDSWPDNEDEAPGRRWARCYGTLRGWVWAQDELPSAREDAEERMLQALRDEPETVDLISPPSDDLIKVQVHPKGLHALLWFRERDWFVGWLSARLKTITDLANEGKLDESKIPQPVTTSRRIQGELASQLASIAYVATTPGPGFDGDLADNPPDEYLDISPVDLWTINKAFLEVNAGRMEALQAIVGPKGLKDSDGNRRMSWNVFMGSMAMRLKTDPVTLAKDRSLVSLLATVALSANHGDIEDMADE